MMGFSRVVWVVFVFALWLDRYVRGTSPSGTAMDHTKGRCVDYVGELCRNLVDYPIYVNDELISMEFLEQSVQNSITAGETALSPDCFDASIGILCYRNFQPCVIEPVSGTALPQQVCRSTCSEVFSVCLNTYTQVVLLGAEYQIPSCGDEYSENLGMEPDAMGLRHSFPVTWYVNGFKGELFFPLEYNTWTNPETLAEFRVDCNDRSAIGKFGVRSTRCVYPMTQWNDTCAVICPHPLFSEDDYHVMYMSYTIPSYVSMASSIVLLLDGLRYLLGKSKRAKKMRQASLVWYQTAAGFLGLLFVACGPGLAVLYHLKSACGSNKVIPEVLDSSYRRVEPLSCKLNRISVYILLSLYNLLSAHLWSTSAKLRAAKRMVMNESGNKSLHLVSTFYVIGVPLILCIAMLSLDELVTNEQFQGQLSRWSFVCGPRLTIIQEMVLVHFPFVLNGILITVQSVVAYRIVRHLAATNSVKQLPRDRASSSLRSIGVALSTVGLLCTVISVLIILCTGIVLPEINTVSDSFNDFLICKIIQASTGYQLQNYESCQDLYDEMGSTTIGNGTHVPGTPSAAMMGLLFCLQSSMPALISVFYLRFIINRIREEAFHSHQRRQRQKRTSMFERKKDKHRIAPSDSTLCAKPADAGTIATAALTSQVVENQ